MLSRLSPLLLSIGAATALGACQSLPEASPIVATQADRHPIMVEQTGARLEIDVGAGDSTLTDKARSDIASFASGYLRYGHGAMILSTPSGAPNSDAASVVAQQTRSALVESGVTYGAVAGSSYEASGAEAAPLILSFTRFEAEAPECAPLWQQDLAHQSNNQPWESFGCAMQANLAAMVEDPHDLVAPRDTDARDSGRRDVVMGHYRAGETTHATRDSDERVSISAVAQ